MEVDAVTAYRRIAAIFCALGVMAGLAAGRLLTLRSERIERESDNIVGGELYPPDFEGGFDVYVRRCITADEFAEW